MYSIDLIHKDFGEHPRQMPRFYALTLEEAERGLKKGEEALKEAGFVCREVTLEHHTYRTFVSPTSMSVEWLAFETAPVESLTPGNLLICALEIATNVDTDESNIDWWLERSGDKANLLRATLERHGVAEKRR